MGETSRVSPTHGERGHQGDNSWDAHPNRENWTTTEPMFVVIHVDTLCDVCVNRFKTHTKHLQYIYMRIIYTYVHMKDYKHIEFNVSMAFPVLV